MRDWLKAGAEILDDPELAVAPQPKREEFRQEWVGNAENAWMM